MGALPDACFASIRAKTERRYTKCKPHGSALMNHSETCTRHITCHTAAMRWMLILLPALSFGCAASDEAPTEFLTDDAEIRTLRQAVIGDYASDLGNISLRGDGTYQGGYAENAGSLLVSASTEHGVFYLRRGQLAPKGTNILQNTVLTLKPADPQVTPKVVDLVVLENGDIKVSRQGMTQIWVRQRER